MTTKYLPVRGYPDYEVSDSGHVYQVLQGRRIKVDPIYQNQGIPYVKLPDADGVFRSFSVRYLVSSHFMAALPLGYTPAPINGNRADCAVSNIKYEVITKRVRADV